MKIKSLIIFGMFLFAGFFEIAFADESSDSTCEMGPSPGENFVFFDCNWVKIPYGWIFENGRWQEDPNILRFGPEPLPTCPREDVCTCSGQYIFYSPSERQCYSSPYPTSDHLKLCEKFKGLNFDGWHFREDVCEWIKTGDPYENDKASQLAVSKVDGNNSIDPEFSLGVIGIGVFVGIGIAVFIVRYRKKRN